MALASTTILYGCRRVGTLSASSIFTSLYHSYYCLPIIVFCYRKGFSNVKLVMKGLGAGFHQPVDGMHSLTMVRYHLHPRICYMVFNGNQVN